MEGGGLWKGGAVKRDFFAPHCNWSSESAERLTSSVSASVKRVGKSDCRIAGLQKTVTSFHQTR